MDGDNGKLEAKEAQPASSFQRSFQAALPPFLIKLLDST